MTVNLETLAAVIGTVGVIATGISTPVFFILRKYRGIMKDNIHLLKKLQEMESWNRKQQEDIASLKGNNLSQNKALLAIARSMKEKGFNHTIDEAISTLEDTILAQQAKSFSYMGGLHD